MRLPLFMRAAHGTTHQRKARMSRNTLLNAFFLAGCLWFASAIATTLDLAGSNWRLVQFTSIESKVLRPDDPAKYTLHFGADGRLSVGADCNRGSASWSSDGIAELTIGPVAATRAMCPPGSMSDQLLRDLSNVARFTIKEGRLSLALKMDAGRYEFESEPSSAAAEEPVEPPAQLAAKAAPTPKPSFDCTKAAPQSAEQSICADPLLAAMDVELARLYKLATAPTAKSAAAIERDQRTWISTRNACASKPDARTCLRDAFAARISDIRAQSKEARSPDEKGISLGPFPFHCEGIAGYVTTTFINAEPENLVRIQSGTSIWILGIGPSGSGARYVGPNGELFWNKGREARFSEGNGKPELNCQQEDMG